jgi:hypothetical protein
VGGGQEIGCRAFVGTISLARSAAFGTSGWDAELRAARNNGNDLTRDPALFSALPVHAHVLGAAIIGSDNVGLIAHKPPTSTA